MSKNLKVGIEVGLDASNAKTNVARFEADFESMLKKIGKTPADIRAFQDVRLAVEQGTRGLWTFDAATQALLKDYQALHAQAQARDILDLVPHEELKRRIEQVKLAFDTLKKSGTLSQTELAQASLRMGDQIRELEKQTNDWTTSLEKAKLGLAGVAAGGAGIAYLVKEASSFESAMADVRKVVDATPERFAALTTEIRDMTRELPLTAKELAAIAAAGGQLGVAADDLGAFTTLAAKMSTAFSMTADDAGNAMAKLSNVFGIPIADMEKLGDAINVLGNNTNAVEKDIVDAMVRVGGSANQFGLAADQTAALTTAILSLGRPPEVAATAISALLTKLQTARVGSKEFQDGLEMIGVSADDLAARVAAKPQAALLDFLKTLERLDAQSRAEVITKMFGLEYQKEISSIVGSLGAYEKTLGLVNDKAAVAGSMAKEFGARMATTEAQAKLLRNELESIGLTIGTAILPAIKATMEGVKPLVQGIADFAAAHPQIAAIGTALGVVATSVGALEVAFGAAKLAGVSSFAAISDEMKKSVKDLSGMRTAVGVLEAAFVGFSVGTWALQFDVVQKAGATMVAGLVKGAEAVRYGWDVALAVFTSDTIEAATTRHRQRVKAIEADLSGLYETVKTKTDGVAAATDRAATATAKVGTEAEKSGEKARAAGEKTTAALKRQEDGARSLAAALGYFGTDVRKSLTGVSSATLDAADQFANLIQNIGGGKDHAEQVAKVFADTWPEAIKKATSPKDLEHFRELLVSLGDGGDIAAAEVSKGLGLIDARLAEVSEGAKETRDALRELREDARRGWEAEKAQAEALDAQQKKTAATERDAIKAKGEGWEALQLGISRASDAARESSASVSEAFPQIEAAGALAKKAFADLVNETANARAVAVFYGDETQARLLSVGALAKKVAEQYQAQADAVDTLTGRIQAGGISVKDADAEVQRAIRSYDLLGSERLSPLLAALSEAHQKTLALGQEARSTLYSLQDELDQMNANYAAVENRKFEAQKAELEAKLKEANDLKNNAAAQDLRDSLRVLDTIHRKKLADIEAENLAKKRDAAAAAQALDDTKKAADYTREMGTPAPGPGTETSAARETASANRTGEFGPSRTIRVEIGAGGPSGTFDSDEMAEKFLRALGGQALRTIG